MEGLSLGGCRRPALMHVLPAHLITDAATQRTLWSLPVVISELQKSGAETRSGTSPLNTWNIKSTLWCFMPSQKRHCVHFKVCNSPLDFLVLEQEQRWRCFKRNERLLSPSGHLRASSCGFSGRDWCLHGLHLNITRTHYFGLKVTHIPQSAAPSPMKYIPAADRVSTRIEISETSDGTKSRPGAVVSLLTPLDPLRQAKRLPIRVIKMLTAHTGHLLHPDYLQPLTSAPVSIEVLNAF